MDEAGIDLAVLSVTTPGVQADLELRVAVHRARDANDRLSSVISRRPKRYAGFAHLPLQDGQAAADELTRCVKELGFKGAMVNGHTNGRYLGEAAYDPFWGDCGVAARFIETASISESVRAKVCHGNAERLLRL